MASLRLFSSIVSGSVPTSPRGSVPVIGLTTFIACDRCLRESNTGGILTHRLSRHADHTDGHPDDVDHTPVTDGTDSLRLRGCRRRCRVQTSRYRVRHRAPTTVPEVRYPTQSPSTHPFSGGGPTVIAPRRPGCRRTSGSPPSPPQTRATDSILGIVPVTCGTGTPVCLTQILMRRPTRGLGSSRAS